MPVLPSLRLHHSFRPIWLLPIVALGACSAGRAGYPSLAQRPAEREFAQTTAATPGLAPETPASADPAAMHQIVTLRADAARANESFARDADQAEHLTQAAHGAGVGSEAWAAATVAMASLDSDHSDTALALGDLDAMRVKTAVSAAEANDARSHATYAAVAEADSAVAAMIKDEETRIAALRKRLDN